MPDATTTIVTTMPTPDLWAAIGVYKATPFSADYDDNVRQFFSPEDQCHAALKALLSAATESIQISMYGEDDPELTAIILTKANDPTVYVQVSLDSVQAAGRAEVPLVAQLRACPNTRVAVGTSKFGKINHLKQFVVDGLYTAGGSMNWSSDGEGKQNNQLIVIKSRAVAHQTIMKLNSDHLYMVAEEAKRASSPSARTPTQTGQP